MLGMRRREVILALGGAAASMTWPLALRAQQQTKIPRIGIIDDSPIWSAFRHGLRDLGYVEGQNIAFEYRYAGGMPDRLAWVAVELVRRPVDLIATFGTAPTLAAKQATTTIPIVMMGVGDPVGSGLVPSLARPGGNISRGTPSLARRSLENACSCSRRFFPLSRAWPSFGIRIMRPILSNLQRCEGRQPHWG